MQSLRRIHVTIFEQQDATTLCCINSVTFVRLQAISFTTKKNKNVLIKKKNVCLPVFPAI